MGSWSERQEVKKEVKEKEKISRETLGKLFFSASIILYIKYLFYIQKQFAYNLHNKYPHEHLHNHFCGS